MATNFTSNFLPMATDAYSALLSRMPAAMDEGLRRKKRQAEQQEEMGNEALKDQRLARKERGDSIRRADADKEQARKDAASEKYAADQRERGDQLSYVATAQQRAQRYGGNAHEAARSATSQFKKMKLGVPGGY